MCSGGLENLSKLLVFGLGGQTSIVNVGVSLHARNQLGLASRAFYCCVRQLGSGLPSVLTIASLAFWVGRLACKTRA